MCHHPEHRHHSLNGLPQALKLVCATLSQLQHPGVLCQSYQWYVQLILISYCSEHRLLISILMLELLRRWVLWRREQWTSCPVRSTRRTGWVCGRKEGKYQVILLARKPFATGNIVHLLPDGRVRAARQSTYPGVLGLHSWMLIRYAMVSQSDVIRWRHYKSSRSTKEDRLKETQSSELMT